MMIENKFSPINGYFSLHKLKPKFIFFAKTDLSDLMNLYKDEANATFRNTSIKAIGRLSVGPGVSNKSYCQKFFMRFPF